MTETEKPRRKPGTFCPLWRKDVSKVCHTCEFYIAVRGKNPQSEEEFDRWGCAWSFVPLLLIENAQQTRQAGAAIESFRNETVKGNQDVCRVIAATALRQHGGSSLLLEDRGESGRPLHSAS